MALALQGWLTRWMAHTGDAGEGSASRRILLKKDDSCFARMAHAVDGSYWRCWGRVFIFRVYYFFMWKYDNLDLYIKARKLIKDLYRLVGKFPRDEMFGLISQIKRAVTSITINIVEGSGKRTSREYISYLNHSVGSVREVGEELSIAYDLGFISEEEMNEYVAETRRIDRMLGKYIEYVRRKDVK